MTTKFDPYYGYKIGARGPEPAGPEATINIFDCHLCAAIKAGDVIDLCPCCDYPECLHAEDAIEVLDWWVFSGSTLPLDEWFRAEVEKRAYR